MQATKKAENSESVYIGLRLARKDAATGKMRIVDTKSFTVKTGNIDLVETLCRKALEKAK